MFTRTHTKVHCFHTKPTLCKQRSVNSAPMNSPRSLAGGTKQRSRSWPSMARVVQRPDEFPPITRRSGGTKQRSRSWPSMWLVLCSGHVCQLDVNLPAAWASKTR